MNATFKIADTVFSLTTKYDSMLKVAKDYISNEFAEVSFTIDKNDIEYEREIEKESNPSLSSTDSYLEFIAVERKLTEYLISKNIYLMHGVLIQKDDKGYLFVAASGTGKSTHANNWKKVFGDKVKIINGDKPFIKIENNVVYAYGSPWCGKEFLQQNKKIILNNVIFLERSQTNSIEKINLADIFPLLYKQTYQSNNKENVSKTLLFLEKLAKSVNLYKLKCNADKESAIAAYKGMTNQFSFEDILDCDGRLTYLTKGTSMLPLLRQDLDLSILDKIYPEDEVKVNDAILFKRSNGQYVLHRLIKIEKDGSYTFLGDNLSRIERGIKREQILAKLVGVDKGNGKYIDIESDEYKKYLNNLTKHRTSRRFKIYIHAKLNNLKTKIKKYLRKR